MSQKSQPSASALNVARCRAIAAHEARTAIRGGDTLAEVFLEAAARQSLCDPNTHALILKKLDAFSPGGYEYFSARTAYLDAVVEQALREHIPQLVLLGAGYDTRAYRFSPLLSKTRVFELDEPVTQAHKRLKLEEARVEIPEQIRYVALDFTVDNLLDKLSAAGYQRDERTLFIWEGVSYYLPAPTVEETLRFIRLNSAAGSGLCFDYMLPKDQLEGRHGAQQAREAMQAMYTAEPLHFELDEAEVKGWLEARGFEMVEHVSAEQMQERYLTLADGQAAGQILDLFRLVQARVR